MKIKDILSSGKATLSFAVFPPQTRDAFKAVDEAVHKIAAQIQSNLSEIVKA